MAIDLDPYEFERSLVEVPEYGEPGVLERLVDSCAAHPLERGTFIVAPRLWDAV